MSSPVGGSFLLTCINLKLVCSMISANCRFANMFIEGMGELNCMAWMRAYSFFFSFERLGFMSSLAFEV